jgi:hypothetical protein
MKVVVVVVGLGVVPVTSFMVITCLVQVTGWKSSRGHDSLVK